LDELSARSRGLYLHRTTKETNIHVPSGIRTYVLDRTATGIGRNIHIDDIIQVIDTC
jgi:hypothetical protein